MSEAMAQGMTDMAWAKNEGLDNVVQRTSENSTPTSFRQVFLAFFTLDTLGGVYWLSWRSE